MGRTARQLIPHLEEHWFEIYGRIATQGQPERFEAPAVALDRYYDAYAFPVGDLKDHCVGILFRDVSERRQAEAHRDMLTRELSHRVKNTLAVVQALARQQGDPGQSVLEYRDRLLGRIQALARAHEQLIETEWESADLSALVEATLSAYGADGERKINVVGDVVRLTPKQGLGLALILHELATNAAKYGSLSVAEGELDVRWALEADQDGTRVSFVWIERGGPPAQSQPVEGFGTRLIRQAGQYELDGSVELKLAESGFTARIVFPIG